MNLEKRFSPLTHSVGPGKLNRNVTLTDVADRLLAEVAAESCASVNRFIREAIALKAATLKTGKALALKAAIAAQDRHVVCSLLALIFIGFIEAKVWAGGDSEEFRRARGKGRIVRTVRLGGREVEVA